MGLPVCFEWIGYGASSNPAATVATKPWCRERPAAFLIGVKIAVGAKRALPPGRANKAG